MQILEVCWQFKNIYKHGEYILLNCNWYDKNFANFLLK